MNRSKRVFLQKLVWSTPVVITVTLPAHAQTSTFCSETDLIGSWEFTSENGEISEFTFFNDGRAGTGTWELRNNIVQVQEIDGGLGATLNEDCRTMSGTLSNAFTGESKFTGRKI